MIAIQDDLEIRKKAVELFLEQKALNGFPENLKDSTQHIITLKGKRLRPLFVLMVAESFGVSENRAMPAAIAIELFHNFTLVHDDIMDKALLRRGKVTVHEKFGVDKAIVTGDAMMPHSIELLIQDEAEKTNAMINSFLKMAKEVMEGQQFDMDFEKRERVSFDEYINMIRLKTSVLFGCACEIGAILGDASKDDQKKLYDFGLYTGLAFQIMDDYLDTFGGSSFGKRIGGDILLDKKTFLLVNALELADSKQNSRISNLFHENKEEDKIAGFQEIFREIGVDKMAIDKMNLYHQMAIDSLVSSSIPDENKQQLMAFSQMMLHRTK